MVVRETRIPPGISTPSEALLSGLFMGVQHGGGAPAEPYHYAIVQRRRGDADTRIEWHIYNRERLDDDNDVVNEKRDGHTNEVCKRREYHGKERGQEPHDSQEWDDRKNPDVCRKRGEREVAKRGDSERRDTELGGGCYGECIAPAKDARRPQRRQEL